MVLACASRGDATRTEVNQPSVPSKASNPEPLVSLVISKAKEREARCTRSQGSPTDLQLGGGG